jgi:glutamine amidotransferase
MCRMLVAVGDVKMSPLVDALIAMASGKALKHGDGWGAAWRSGRSWKLVRSVKPCYEDEKIGELRTVKSDLTIMHARKASPGYAVALENTHPFKRGSWIFCHNGDVRDKLDFSPKFKLKGDTDSERLFYFILSNLEKGNEVASIRNALSVLKDCTAADFILSSMKKVYVAVKFSKEPDYYTMHLGERNGLIVVSSEVLQELDMRWTPLPDGSIVEIDASTGGYKIHK